MTQTTMSSLENAASTGWFTGMVLFSLLLLLFYGIGLGMVFKKADAPVACAFLPCSYVKK